MKDFKKSKQNNILQAIMWPKTDGIPKSYRFFKICRIFDIGTIRDIFS